MKRARIIVPILAAVPALLLTGASGGCGSDGSASGGSDTTQAAGGAGQGGHTTSGAVLVPNGAGITGVCDVIIDDPEPGKGIGDIPAQPVAAPGRIFTFVSITNCKDVPIYATIVVQLIANTGNGFRSVSSNSECDTLQLAGCEVEANCYEGKYYTSASVTLEFADTEVPPLLTSSKPPVTVSAGDCNA